MESSTQNNSRQTNSENEEKKVEVLARLTASLVNIHTIKSVSLMPSSDIFWSSFSTLPVKMSFCLSDAKSALLAAMAFFTVAT